MVKNKKIKKLRHALKEPSRRVVLLRWVL